MRILIRLIVLCAIGGALAYFLTRKEEIVITVAPVARGHVEQTIASIAAGTVIPRQDSMIAAGMMGTIFSVPEEGQRIEQGGILVELDHAELDAQVALAEANLRAGQSKLEQAKLAAGIYKEINAAKVSLTKSQLELARSEFDRIRALSEKKAVSQSDLDKAASALHVAEENHAAAVASEKENQVRVEEVRGAESAIEQLEAACDAAKAARERAFVKAPFPGVVAKRILDVGEATALGAPLLQFVEDEECYVQAPFDEANAAEVKVGQKARLNLDAYRGEDFSGEVVYIAPVVSLNRDLSRSLDVKIRIDAGREKFVSGMSVDVTIICDEKEDVVFVPSESLIREEIAYVVERGTAVRREVKTGVGNWSTVEVLDGLKEGEQLITSVAVDGLVDGAKVRIVKKLEDK